MSETRKVCTIFPNIIEDYFSPDLKVCDIGFGGDKVVPYADGIDQPTPYTNLGGDVNDIPCRVEQGIPVEDNTYDVVFSSHLIEDFVDTKNILTEFLRILKKDGTLILIFPDQQSFEYYCLTTGQLGNDAHQIPNMGYWYMRQQLDAIVEWEELWSNDREIPYNVVMVCRIKG